MTSDSEAIRLDNQQLNETIENLEAADNGHLDWLRRIHECLVCGSEVGSDIFDTEAHRTCRFGVWYYENSPEGLRELSKFQALRPLHEEMHTRGRELALTRLKSGQVSPAEYNAFIDVQLGLSSLLLELRDDLRQWQLSHDKLTGLLTRAPFEKLISGEYARCERGQVSSCVALLDIDFFKHVNDNWGHATGDSILRFIGKMLQENLRPYDAVCRYGGEEFAVLLPHTSVGSSYAVLERIRSRLEETDIRVADGTVVNITFSGGIAPLTEPGWNKNMELADMCLYQAKAEGRNRIVALDET